MPADVLTSWAWVFWLALILVFLIIEVLSLSFVFLMLAVGSLGGLVAGLLGARRPGGSGPRSPRAPVGGRADRRRGPLAAAAVLRPPAAAAPDAPRSRS